LRAGGGNKKKFTFGGKGGIGMDSSDEGSASSSEQKKSSPT